MSILNDSVQRLALGTVQFGLPYGVANKNGKVSGASAKKMLQLAFSSGIDTIDTAIGYGDSESCLGEIGIKHFRVITKLSAVPSGILDVKTWVNEQIQSSLDRLGLKRIYGVLLHRPLELLDTRGQDYFEALRELKERGQVKKIGISIYSPTELQLLTEKYHFDLVQGPLNLVDRRLLESGWLSRMKDDGVEIHTRSAFLQGLLLMQRHSIPEKFSRWNELWENWHQWLSSEGEAALNACLAFPLSIPEIDRVVVGADSLDQLQEIVRAAKDGSKTNIPDIAHEAEELINPANWSNL